MTVAPDIVAAFAPTGELRASINTGNPILAGSDPAPGAKGVSVDLARGFAQRLGVELELVVFDTAGKSVDAVTQEQADIGFFAIDPKRGEGIHFTAPYVLIEGCYAVRDDSPLTANEQVDRAGTRVVVGKGSAYDLFLTPRAEARHDPACAELARGGRLLPGAGRRRRRRREAAAARPMRSGWAACACCRGASW